MPEKNCDVLIKDVGCDFGSYKAVRRDQPVGKNDELLGLELTEAQAKKVVEALRDAYASGQRSTI